MSLFNPDWTMPALIRDGLQNVISRMGTTLDKGASTQYFRTQLGLEELEAAFSSSWVLKKMIKTIPFDATRRWREWDEGETEVDLIDKVERRLKIQQKVKAAQTMARLYGGAGLMIGIGNEPLDEPLDPSRVKKGGIKYLTMLTRLQLTAVELEDDAREERFGRARMFQIATGQGQQLTVHPSRVVEFFGEPLPDPFRAPPEYYGWGESCLEAMMEAGKGIDESASSIRSLVSEAKTDVIKIPGLTRNITDAEFEKALLKRAEVARFSKGNHGMMLIDGEEEYAQNTYAYSGLGDIMDRFMLLASGAADIPMTRLFGMSPGGMNSTGRSDMNNYYDRVQAMQTGDIDPEMETLDQCIARDAFGAEGNSRFKWREIEQMSDEQLAEIRDKTAKTIKTIGDTRLYADEDVAEAGADSLARVGIKGLEGKRPSDDRTENEPGEDGAG